MTMYVFHKRDYAKFLNPAVEIHFFTLTVVECAFDILHEESKY